MPIKKNARIVPQFKGRHGKRNLIDALCVQSIVANDNILAKRLLTAGKLYNYRTRQVVMRQGDSDTDIYFILSGSVGIFVNHREVATREVGEHVGEMAMLDPTARRSASIITEEKTCLLKVPESAMVPIIKLYPAILRRIAVELSHRLRERAKFISIPNSKPHIFIGSSTEALNEAKEISNALRRRHGLDCSIWADSVFTLSQTTIEDLIKISGRIDFAMLLLTADDVISSRGRRKLSPRDNVVFELGLFIGAIGRDRTYMIVPSDQNIKIPTDLLGVNYGTYQTGRKQTVKRRLSGLIQEMTNEILKLGPK